MHPCPSNLASCFICAAFRISQSPLQPLYRYKILTGIVNKRHFQWSISNSSFQDFWGLTTASSSPPNGSHPKHQDVGSRSGSTSKNGNVSKSRQGHLDVGDDENMPGQQECSSDSSSDSSLVPAKAGCPGTEGTSSQHCAPFPDLLHNLDFHHPRVANCRQSSIETVSGVMDCSVDKEQEPKAGGVTRSIQGSEQTQSKGDQGNWKSGSSGRGYLEAEAERLHPPSFGPQGLSSQGLIMEIFLQILNIIRMMFKQSWEPADIST